MKNILNIITIILTAITIIYISISNSITEKSIKETSRQVTKSGLIYNEDKTYTEIFKKIVKLTTLSEDDVIKMLELDYVNEELTKIIDSIYEYNLTKNSKVKYTKEQIINLTKNNIDKITNDINYNLQDSERKKAIEYVENNTDYIIKEIYITNIGDWKKNE